MPGGAARPLRVDQHMSGQTIAFVGVVYWVAVVGDRIAHAGAHRDDGESGNANGVAEPAFVQQHRVEVVEHLGGNAGVPLQHAAQVNAGIPVQERREGDVTVVLDVAAERKTKRGGRGGVGGGGDEFTHHAGDLLDHGLWGGVRHGFGDVTADGAAHRVHLGHRDGAVVNVDADEGMRVLANAQRGLRAAAAFT